MPDKQQVIVNFPLGNMEFRQNKTITHFIDHEAKTYREYPTFAPLQFKPQGAATIFFPVAFFRVKFDINREMKPLKTSDAVVNGVHGEEFQFGGPGKIQGTSTFDVVVDRYGRMIKVSFDIDENGTIIRRHHFLTNYNTNASEIKIRDEIEPGYVPEAAISQKLTPIPSDGFPFEKVVQASNGSTKDLAREFKGKSVLILITDPSCQPSKQGAKIWQKLADLAKSYKSELIEVSLTSQKPVTSNSWRLFYDKSGSFENAVQPPVTPYLFLVDKEGTIFQSWAGINADQEQRIIKTFKTGFEQIK